MRSKTPFTSSMCTNNITFVTHELFSFGAAQTRTMILEQDCRFQTTTTYSVYDICRLQTADRRPQTADCGPQTADCRLQTAGGSKTD